MAVNIQDITLNSVYAVGSLVIIIAAGFILFKLRVLTRENRRILSECNFYVIGAVFALVEVMNVIDRTKLSEIGYIVFGSISNIVIGFIVCFIVVFLFDFDVRLRFSFTFVCVYANIVIFPDMLSKATCTTGINVGDKNCPKQKSYASISLIYITCLYWVTIYPVLKYERLTRLKIMRVFAIALQFYESVEKFLEDTTFDKYSIPNFMSATLGKEAQIVQVVGTTTESSMNPPALTERVLAFPRTSPLLTTDAYFETENANTHISGKKYAQILSHFAEFEKVVLSKPEVAKAMEIITKEVLVPAKIGHIEENLQIFSWEFLKTRLLYSPPASFAILGLILGFIFPFKEFVFGTYDPMPLLITTLRSIGSMYSTISMILLGTTIAEGAVITREMVVGWKHVVLSNVIRNAILPFIGLFWVFVVIKAMDNKLFMTNGVIMLIDYIYWIAPNGIGLVTVYIMADYPAREFGVMSVYMNILSIPFMTIHLIIYSAIYTSYK